MADGTQIQSFTVPYDPTDLFSMVHALEFTPDGTALAAAISYEPTRIWRISDGALLRSIERAAGGSLAFTDDGQTLLIGGDNTLYRWAVR